MVTELTGDDLFSEILIMRNVSQKVFILVEGEGDCAAIDPHLSQDECESMIGYSKSAVLRAIELVEEQEVERVVALVDRDWWGVVSEPPSNQNLIYTDEYDLDATIFYSENVADRVFAAFVDKGMRQDFMSGPLGGDLREIISALAYPVGALRYLSIKDGHQISLRDFPIHQAISPDCSSVDIRRVVDIAYGRSGGIPSISKSDLVVKIETLDISPHATRSLCSGHDLMAAFAHLLRQIFSRKIGRDNLERTLRVAFGEYEIRSTALYRKLHAWANARRLTIWRYTEIAHQP